MSELVAWLRSQRFIEQPDLPAVERSWREGWNTALRAVERELVNIRDSADHAACQLLREGQG